MKVLIIGANSLISQSLISLINSKQVYEIFGVINVKKNNLKEKARYLSTDELFLISDKFEKIFFIASYIPFGNYNSVEKKLIDTNIILLKKVIDNFPEAQINYISSIAVNGLNTMKIDEFSGYNPDNNYAITKLAGETITKTADNYTIIRLPSIYGSGVITDTFIPRCIKNALETKKINIYGDGVRLQNYLH